VQCCQDVLSRPWSHKKTMCGFVNAPGCLPLNGCGSNMAFPYFISFTLLISFVFLNLFIAVIIEGFSVSEYVRRAPAAPRTAPRLSTPRPAPPSAFAAHPLYPPSPNSPSPLVAAAHCSHRVRQRRSPVAAALCAKCFVVPWFNFVPVVCPRVACLFAVAAAASRSQCSPPTT
jgi:hypothetical protein